MDNNSNSVVEISARKANLKRRLRLHLRPLGFERDEDGALRIQVNNKDTIRKLHHAQRDERLETNYKFISEKGKDLIDFFATGKDIEQSKFHRFWNA